MQCKKENSSVVVAIKETPPDETSSDEVSELLSIN
jgi:hypothetical protein